LGHLIFRDEKARKDLNRILHPLIIEEMKRQTEIAFSEQPEAVVVWDVPLLIEENLTQFVEKVIVVYVPESLQLARLMRRNHLTEEEAKRRISAQLSIEEKKKRADVVIDNSGSLAETERQVDRIWNWLKSESGFNRRSTPCHPNESC
jgi:dephospho-CoA kinase